MSTDATPGRAVVVSRRHAVIRARIRIHPRAHPSPHPSPRAARRSTARGRRSRSRSIARSIAGPARLFARRAFSTSNTGENRHRPFVTRRDPPAIARRASNPARR